MNELGKIKFAEQEGVFVLKLIGEIRLTLSSTLDYKIEKSLVEQNFISIIIDLSETDYLDSTTLGLIAKLSVISKSKTGLLPVIITTKPDITYLLCSMGFDTVFNLIKHPISCPKALMDLPPQDQEDAVIRRKVLEAHRILMEMNQQNYSTFKDFVEQLEKE